MYKQTLLCNEINNRMIEINYDLDFLYGVECIYTKNMMLNEIKSKIFQLNYLINQIEMNNNLSSQLRQKNEIPVNTNEFLASNRPSVLLISIDAMRPDIVFEAEKHGIKLPNMCTYFIENGSYVRNGVEGVFPTVTYPAHQSIITGTNPSIHGIYNNRVWDPEGKHLGAWEWYVSNKTTNLWKAAKQNGYLSANVGFPTSVGAHADFNIPEYWRDKTELDSKVLNAVSYPQGLVKEMEKEIGRYPSYDFSLEGDSKRYDAALWLIENKIKPQIPQNPFFMTAYFAAYDEYAHKYGTFSKESLKALEEIDGMIGKLVKEVHKITNDNVVVAVVSDHGMVDNIANISPNTELYKAGLIKIDKNGKVTNWDAYFQKAEGSGQIKLKDPNNIEVRHKVEAILNKLKADNNSGILAVMTGKEAELKLHGFPEADYVLIAKLGYQTTENITGDYITDKLADKATHGFLPQFKEMKSSFFIEGKSISKNKDIKEMKIVDIAPLLAKLMGFN